MFEVSLGILILVFLFPCIASVPAPLPGYHRLFCFVLVKHDIFPPESFPLSTSIVPTSSLALWPSYIPFHLKGAATAPNTKHTYLLFHSTISTHAAHFQESKAAVPKTTNSLLPSTPHGRAIHPLVHHTLPHENHQHENAEHCEAAENFL